jgi:hypothetical protein
MSEHTSALLIIITNLMLFGITLVLAVITGMDNHALAKITLILTRTNARPNKTKNTTTPTAEAEADNI